MTGLRNKRYFLEAFDEMFARSMRIGIDLGGLFLIWIASSRSTTPCGHGFGDYVLKTVDNLLREVASSSEQARSVAERLRAKVEAFRFAGQGRSWPVTLSVGVAALRVHAPATASALLQLADQALYTAKGAGRNRVVCSSG